MTSVPVLVTGVGGGGVGEQIIKALRLGKVDYDIHGTDIVGASYGFAGTDHSHVLPRATDDGYVDALLAVCERTGIRAILPGSEAELTVISAQRARFAGTDVVIPINPETVIDVCMDKFKTFEWLRKQGYAVPDTRLITTREDLDGVDFLPAVLKPGVGGGGSANLFLAQSSRDLRALGGHLLTAIGPFVVQQYLGTIESEYTVGVLNDLDGTLVDSIAVRRDITSGLSNRIKVANQTGNDAFGGTLAISSGVSQGDVGRFRDVTEECERIAGSLGARGAINIQCRLWEGRPHVFEINPRFSGTTSIRAMVGYNEPDWLIRKHVLGERLTGPLDYRESRVLRGLEERVVSPLER